MSGAAGWEGALWSLAEALQGLYAVEQARLALERERLSLEYPPKKEARDAVLTRRQTEEEALREDQGAGDETLEDWIGLRERNYVEAEAGSEPGESSTAKARRKRR